MLSKKNLWFITLFSIILVMAVYYVSIPVDDAILVNKEVENVQDISLDIEESSAISALKVSRDETLENEVAAIKEILTNEQTTTEEKSDAYEALKNLNINKGKEETIEKLIKKDFNYDTFVRIDGTNIKVVVDSDTHSYELANGIIKTVQNEFDQKVYVTVSFNTK